MPSPFPGMDPYLESDLWTSFHALLAGEMARELNPRLRPRYLALPQRRFVTDAPDEYEIAIEDMYPDVAVMESGTRKSKTFGRRTFRASVQMATVMPATVPHLWVEIRDVKNRRIVTEIELRSLPNKRGPGRNLYLKKRNKILCSKVHLMEIDLLRKGRRVPMDGALPGADYFVFICRAGKRPLTETWPISVKDRLPTVPVPLLEDDPDIALNLQKAFTKVYDDGSFDLAIDYSRPPDIPLVPENAAWAKSRLRIWLKNLKK